MSLNSTPSQEVLSDITLEALIRLLYIKGINLDELLNDYSAKILDNYLTGSTFKNQTPDHLQQIIEETKTNSILNRMR